MDTKQCQFCRLSVLSDWKVIDRDTVVNRLDNMIDKLQIQCDVKGNCFKRTDVPRPS